MTAYNFTMFTGNDKFLQVTLKDVNEVAINITGWSIEFALRLQKDDVTLISKTVGSGISIDDGLNGIFTVSIDDTDTDALAEGSYWYEIKTTNLSGVETTVLNGKAKMYQSILVPGS